MHVLILLYFGLKEFTVFFSFKKLCLYNGNLMVRQ